MEKIIEILKSCGINRVGFCTYEGVKNALLPCRNSARLPQNSKTVICAVFPYRVESAPPKNISRYAATKDYHLVCGEMLNTAAEKLKALFPENAFEPFIDNSPINEVLALSKTGLGKVGQNGLFIDDRFGSFVFLGEIVTDLDLNVTDHSPTPCLGCGKCKAACPVGLKNEDCLSKITQQKGELSAEQQAEIKKSGCVWGCDICSEVCPENSGKDLTDIAEFLSTYRPCFSPTEDFCDRAYTWRGEKVILRNYEIIKNGK